MRRAAQLRLGRARCARPGRPRRRAAAAGRCSLGRCRASAGGAASGGAGAAPPAQPRPARFLRPRARSAAAASAGAAAPRERARGGGGGRRSGRREAASGGAARAAGGVSFGRRSAFGGGCGFGRRTSAGASSAGVPRRRLRPRRRSLGGRGFLRWGVGGRRGGQFGGALRGRWLRGGRRLGGSRVGGCRRGSCLGRRRLVFGLGGLRGHARSTSLSRGAGAKSRRRIPRARHRVSGGCLTAMEIPRVSCS